MAADFDLTGQMVWPGAELLNDYLSKNSDILRGCSVIELGSGVGEYLLLKFQGTAYNILFLLPMANNRKKNLSLSPYSLHVTCSIILELPVQL